MERIINFLKQNRFKVFLIIIIISAIVLVGVILLRNNNSNSLNAEIQQYCETMCVYNFNKSTWDFSKQSTNQNINRSFATKDGCIGFCIVMSGVKNL
ncbi:hypothetical protein L6274_05020 [Candidatus Parcubacteria bacterium]|nr:hypothetical protein [Candidatus Parcubacteria bacterium]